MNTAGNVARKDRMRKIGWGNFAKQQTTTSSLAQQVKKLAQKCEGLDHLCGEMLATFNLPQNAEAFAKIGGEWPRVLESWVKQYQKWQDAKPTEGDEPGPSKVEM